MQSKHSSQKDDQTQMSNNSLEHWSPTYKTFNMIPKFAFADQLAVEQVGPGQYISRLRPAAYGNVGGIAFGGCTTAIAGSAAYAEVPKNYHLYSFVGHFLGPATTTAKLHCTVHVVRDTKTFATRRVVVTQQQPDGKIRSCLEVLADFHVKEPALLTYSSPPALKYKAPEESPTLKDLVDKAIADGIVNEDPIAKFAPMFYEAERYWEMKTCTEGMSGQNLVGMLANALPTDQDNLPVTDRVSSDWMRLRTPLTSDSEKAAALLFLLDGGVPFVALTHNYLWYSDSGPCNTLEFALRLFEPVVDINQWHVRERKTVVAGHGRSYNEARLFNQAGVLTASMTQQCILRPKPESNKGKSSL